MYDFAVIFDMDGVIIENSEYHKRAWDKFAEKYGKELTEEERKYHIYGTTNKTALKYILKRELTSGELNMYGAEKEEIYREIYRPYIKTTDNLIDFLDMLRGNNIDIGIATSAGKENVDFIMNNLGIQWYFKKIIDADQIEKGKPNPEIYLKAAEELGYIPAKCIAIEDTVSGIIAGKNAGMKVIAITTTHLREELEEADLVIDNFNELDDMRKIIELVEKI